MIQPQDLRVYNTRKPCHSRPSSTTSQAGDKTGLVWIGDSIDFQCCQGFFFFYKINYKLQQNETGRTSWNKKGDHWVNKRSDGSFTGRRYSLWSCAEKESMLTRLYALPNKSAIVVILFCFFFQNRDANRDDNWNESV